MFTLLWLEFSDSRRSKDVVQLVGQGMPFNRADFPECTFVKVLGVFESMAHADRLRQILWETLEKKPLSYEQAYLILGRPDTGQGSSVARTFRSISGGLSQQRAGR